MSEQELNKKLAEWAGLDIEAEAKKEYVQDVREYRGRGYIGNETWERDCEEWRKQSYRHNVIPDFTQSLDACIKWLVPEAKKRDINLRIVLSTQGLLTTVEIFGSNPFDDDYPTKKLAWAMDEEPALALCLAIAKLIDGEGDETKR